MLTQSNKNSNSLEDSQVECLINDKNSLVTQLECIGQSSALVGTQVLCNHLLLSSGVMGLFPVTVAVLPVVGSLAMSVTNLSFDDGIEIIDKSKLPGQVIRTVVVAGNAVKIISDNSSLEDTAKQSFEVIARQERVYRGLPDTGDFSLILPGFIICAIALFMILKRK